MKLRPRSEGTRGWPRGPPESHVDRHGLLVLQAWIAMWRSNSDKAPLQFQSLPEFVSPLYHKLYLSGAWGHERTARIPVCGGIARFFGWGSLFFWPSRTDPRRKEPCIKYPSPRLCKSGECRRSALVSAKSSGVCTARGSNNLEKRWQTGLKILFIVPAFCYDYKRWWRNFIRQNIFSSG